MTTQLYSLIYASVDGLLLTEEASITITKNAGLNPVFTVAKGFAGMSQGAPTVEIDVDNAVPSADFEFNPDAKMLEGQTVEIGILMAGRQTVVTGFITSATYSHSVNAESKMSFKVMANFEPFE